MSNDSIPASTTKMQEEAPENTFPIARKATEKGQPNQPGEPEERPNKYFYPEFAGYSGERYLDSLVQQILPAALHRTWWYAVDYQAPGSECYVGTARLANRVKPGIRKIELDFQELQARGLMKCYPAHLPVMQEDGTTRQRAVTVKDFRALYDLAHEFHLWLNSDEFIPPDREYRQFIVENLKLLAKLVRFDCYRRLVECAKPGRKPQAQPVHYYYHYQCSQPTEEATENAASPRGGEEQLNHATATGGVEYDESRRSTTPRTNGQNANHYSKTFENVSSAYRESEKENLLTPTDMDSNHYEGSIPPPAIRNSSEIEIESTIEIGTEDTKKPNENDNVSKSKTPNPTQKEMTSARATRVNDNGTLDIEYLKQDPFALATALAEMVINERQTLRPVQEPRRPNQRKRRGTPEALARDMTYYAQQLGGNPDNLQSDITRVTKVYWTATQVIQNFTNKWFQEQLKEAFGKAFHKRKCRNRLAYFFTCLENCLHLAPDERAYLLSEEPLYQDGWLQDFTRALRRQYAALEY